jgi:ABC-type dipeptide/oligopeptide/nickel transport system ATPase subunit
MATSRINIALALNLIAVAMLTNEPISMTLDYYDGMRIVKLLWIVMAFI